MPLRGLSALIFLGGILCALLSGNWGIGAMPSTSVPLCFALVQGKCVLGLWLSVHCSFHRPE